MRGDGTDREKGLPEDSTFTIYSSHAYDLSEEEEVLSHKDSKMSFVNDSSILLEDNDPSSRPVGFEEMND